MTKSSFIYLISAALYMFLWQLSIKQSWLIQYYLWLIFNFSRCAPGNSCSERNSMIVPIFAFRCEQKPLNLKVIAHQRLAFEKCDYIGAYLEITVLVSMLNVNSQLLPQRTPISACSVRPDHSQKTTFQC